MKMRELIEKLDNSIKKIDSINAEEFRILFQNALKELKNHHKIDKYIGDFPTFIEPVFLGENVRLGDDVLLGPNVYIGNNCELGDFVELSNTIIQDNVKLGNNFTLNNCIITKNSNFNFNNYNVKNCILMGVTDTKDGLKKVVF
jgi:NDP-sugar pyrophosphorylase family protein